MFYTSVNEVLSSLSLALDVAENQPMEHAQRTAYIALQIAHRLELQPKNMESIYMAALLHDIGATHSKAEAHADGNQLVSHCVLGKEIASSLSFVLDSVRENILWHHANWDGSGPFEPQGNEIPLGAQIIYLADQVDLRLRKLSSIYDNDRESIIGYVRDHSGNLFNPELVQVFLEIQDKERFWLDYSTGNFADRDSELPFGNELLDLSGLEEVATVFARIIDNKSPFTHSHSQGVAQLVSDLGRYYGFDTETVQKLKISGLLHDLGKLAIPNAILDKPGKLTTAEFQIVKGHAYYTKLILSKIRGFADMKEWAGNHHETVDSKGYPEGVTGSKLSLQERMMTVCDIYQALTEERPYRAKPLTRTKVYEIMDEQAQNNKICREVYALFKEMLD